LITCQKTPAIYSISRALSLSSGNTSKVNQLFREDLRLADLKRILFVCVENAGRSQMAEAFANQYGKGKVIASSAGVKLADRVNPIVVDVMKEKGSDISSNKPKLLNREMAEKADRVITMGCSVERFCPAPIFGKVTDWNLDDPKGKPIEKVREIRDEIENRVKILLKELNSSV